MTKAITDTGPVLHLHEIGRLESLKIFDQLALPDLVVEELHACGINLADLSARGLSISNVTIATAEWHSVISEAHKPTIHPADAQVFVLARSDQFQTAILTDDLALRRHLESEGAIVVGSVGILVRAYTIGHLKRDELERAIDSLFTTSTLHLSRAFRAYIRQLLADLP